MYVATEAGSYAVQVTDTNGCTTTSNAVLVSGVPDLLEENISIYPNPSVNSWQLTVDNSLVGSALEVFDEQGRIAFQSKISFLKSRIDLNIANGVYYLHINNNIRSIVKKLIKL